MDDSSCPRCGERLLPVLHRTTPGPEKGLLSADPPVHLECPRCHERPGGD